MAFTRPPQHLASDMRHTEKGPAAGEQATVQRAPTVSSASSAGSPRQLRQEQLLAGLRGTEPPQRPAGHGGLPEGLRAGIESLSGLDLSGVRVHRNSSKPAALQANAYAQGQDIHLGPGQEEHLPHEAWHVVQQAQGRVRPTMQMKGGVPVNDDGALEREADQMGAKASAAKGQPV